MFLHLKRFVNVSTALELLAQHRLYHKVFTTEEVAFILYKLGLIEDEPDKPLAVVGPYSGK